MEAAAYFALAKELIPAVLEKELAAPWLEVEARLADSKLGSCPHVVEPHHLSHARHVLVEDGLIASRTETTRGGRSVTLWSLKGARRGEKALDRAAARKRLVTARYLGWTQGSPSRPGLTGLAAETVAHESILDAAPHGFSLANPNGPGVGTFLGLSVPIGPLDSAAIRTNLVDGVPSGYAAIPIEVKNLRDWIYPSSHQLYQLLSKAAQIQNLRPTVPIAPVLICRRAHITTMRMAKALGFFVIPTQRQYISEAAGERLVTEVRSELGFVDLVRQTSADQKITDYLVKHLPKVLERTTDLWKETAGAFADDFEAIRLEPDISKRVSLLYAMKQKYRADWELDFELGW